MIAASELVFSDAELTLLARMLDEEYFPATLPPELDDDGWKAVERGLIARGTVHGRFRRAVADDVAQVLEVVLRAERSLWSTVSFAPGAGESRGLILWFRGDEVVRQAAETDGPQHLVVCDRSAIDDMLDAALDFPTAAGSQAGPAVTMPIGDLAEALQLASRETPAAAAAQFPPAAELLTTLVGARHSVTIESRRRVDDGGERREMVSLSESLTHDLWLAYDEPYTDDDLTGVLSHLQRVTIDMAREAATTLAMGPG
ncbi:MAG: hypothetical protein QOD69_492 [Solirubrobacteraceae bacterium]|nr:hypothetical protein [Solirubrobacteraceae bacterium]